METSATSAGQALPEPGRRSWALRFFALWTGQMVSQLGSQLVQFAVIWYLATTTGSASALTFAALVGVLPQVALSPLIGALADRWSRRAIMIAADLAIVIATLALAVLFALGLVAPWQIYLLLLVRAVGGGFHGSAWGASIVLLVPRQHLARIQGINQAALGALTMLAPPLGALLLALLPLQGVLAIDVATALPALVTLCLVALPRPPVRSGPPQSILADIRDGLRYVSRWPGLMIILGMAALINGLLTPSAALLPLLVTKHFRGGASQLAWLDAATGAGIVLGGLLLGVWGGFRRRVVTAMIGLIGMGIGTAALGFIPADAFIYALVAVALSGLMTPITNGSLGAAIQAAVAPAMQGRVFALVMSLATAVAPLGLMLAGPLGDRFGVRLWFVIGGVVCALMGLIGLVIPAVMRLEETQPHADPISEQNDRTTTTRRHNDTKLS